jgi:hypothetical protein
MKKKSKIQLELELNEAKARLAVYEAEREAAEAPSRWPAEPPNGSVLKFEHSFPHSARTYTYAALRVDGLWYTTSVNSSIRRTTWENLRAFVGDTARASLATEFFDIPVLEPEDTGATMLSAIDYVRKSFVVHEDD